MSLQSFLFPHTAELVEGATVGLAGEEGHHAASVMRIRPGEEIFLVDGKGRRARGEVLQASKNQVQVKVLATVNEAFPGKQINLVQALAKGGRDEMSIETATELDVFAVIPWQADRSTVRWNGPKVEKGVRKWQAKVAAATKQSRRSYIPEVASLVGTKALAKQIEEAVANNTLVLLLHEEAETPLMQQPLQEADRIWLIVGPEGGIGQAETELLVKSGARTCKLGSTILRTSSAGPAALAYIAGTCGAWNS